MGQILWADTDHFHGCRCSDQLSDNIIRFGLGGLSLICVSHDWRFAILKEHRSYSMVTQAQRYSPESRPACLPELYRAGDHRDQ